MATVTGALSDFGLKPFPELQPRLIFTPSGPSLSVSRLFATKPVIVRPFGSGSFSVELQPTTTLRPVVWYTVTVEWLDPAGNYVSSDELSWKLFVPTAGGELSNLLETPANPFLFWVGDTEPPNPQTGMLWLYTGPTTSSRTRGSIYKLRS